MSATCPQLGFTLHLAPSADLDDAMRGELHRAFVAFVAARGLSSNGRSDAGQWSLAVWRDGSQADDADREAMRAWVAERPALAMVSLGLLFDVEYSG